MKVLLVTGSSGGHIFPSLGFLDFIRRTRPDIETLLMLPKSASVPGDVFGKYKVRRISATALRFQLNKKNIYAAVSFLKGAVESLIVIFGFRPDVVIGFGSIASVPCVLFAWILRIRTIVHEQNLVPGRANRFLGHFCDRIAVSFKESRAYFGVSSSKTVFTGMPLRNDMARMDKSMALDFFGLSRNKFTVLVMGGSLGSSHINRQFFLSAERLRQGHDFQVIHLSGPSDFGWLAAGYKKLALEARVFKFLEKMQYAYSASDLVLCRGGALTIAEIVYFRVPAVIVPYPFAHQHQRRNAEFLKAREAALVIEDSTLKADELAAVLGDLASRPEKLASMRERMNGIPLVDEAGALVGETLAVAGDFS